MTTTVRPTSSRFSTAAESVARGRAARSSSPRSAAKADADRLLRSYAASLSDERRVLFDRYRFVDIARKVVGVGSVGTRAWGGSESFDRAMVDFAEADADQNERDHAELQRAVADGRVAASVGI